MENELWIFPIHGATVWSSFKCSPTLSNQLSHSSMFNNKLTAFSDSGLPPHPLPGLRWIPFCSAVKHHTKEGNSRNKILKKTLLVGFCELGLINSDLFLFVNVRLLKTVHFSDSKRARISVDDNDEEEDEERDNSDKRSRSSSPSATQGMTSVTPMPLPLTTSSATPSPEIARSSAEREDGDEGRCLEMVESNHPCRREYKGRHFRWRKRQRVPVTRKPVPAEEMLFSPPGSAAPVHPIPPTVPGVPPASVPAAVSAGAEIAGRYIN